MDQDSAAASFPPSDSSRPPMTEEIKQMLTCPISLDYMHDPVTLVQTRQTYDRKSLCEWLLEDPTRCPVTNRHFTEKLEYDDNLTARQLLMVYLGDDAYQPYDDSIFQLQYKILWSQTIHNEEPPLTTSSTNIHASLSTEPPVLLFETRTDPRATLSGNITNDVDTRQVSYQDEADAQFKLGLCYATGRGVPQDYEQARVCYERAAGLGHAAAQCNLGTLYYKGQGVTRNYKRARLMYELAAAQGTASAQCNLGILYEHGLGVPKDCIQSKYLYEQAAAKGHERAQRMLRRSKQTKRKIHQRIIESFSQWFI